jgi:transmembrane sensor
VVTLAITPPLPTTIPRISANKNGSVPTARLTLNTNSRVILRHTPSCLHIHILQGELLLDIEHRPTRRVEVFAGNALIDDIGTTFDVRMKDDRVTVIVLDGTLELSSLQRRQADTESPVPSDRLRLRKGERGDVFPSGLPSPLTAQSLSTSQIEAELSWRSGTLIFEAASVETIAQEFNRYNRHPRIAIRDRRIASVKLSGVFDPHQPQSFISALQQLEPGMQVTRSNAPDRDILLDAARR